MTTPTDYPRCATCRHAKASDPAETGTWMRSTVRRKADRFPLFCLRASMDSGEPGDPQTKCMTMDGSDYAGDLLVTPDFGCVQHEPMLADATPACEKHTFTLP